MKPGISIIVPCYNQAGYLDECLQSVLDQTYQDWECIIVNDGSLDNTQEIAQLWLQKDTRFEYVFKENGGLSSARNAGLKLAKGDFIQFLDADDLIKPTKFEKQIKDLNNAQISISDYFSFVDGNIELSAKHRYLSPFVSEINFKKEIILDWEYRKSIPCHSVLFKKEILDDNNILFNESLPNHEDWVFWSQLFYASKSIKNNEDVLALYRIRNDSMTVDYVSMREGFLKAAKILKDYFKLKGENELFNTVCFKQNEIYKRNKQPFFKKIKSKLFAKLIYTYHYVKSY